MKPKVNVFWFRRDLRLEDNAGLWHALQDELPVLPLFVFDKNILDRLSDRSDRRLTFIYRALEAIQDALHPHGAAIRAEYGTPVQAFEKLFGEFEVHSVYVNRDYEPYARDRDAAIRGFCKKQGVALRDFKDQVIFEKDEVLKPDGTPYTVFTPYGNRWKARLSPGDLEPYNSMGRPGDFYKCAYRLPALPDLGFMENDSCLPTIRIDKTSIREYHRHRDFPARDRTTYAGTHLRFGTVSIRALVKKARVNEKYLNELIWREFFMQVLWHFPHVANGPFRKQYESIPWRQDERSFEKWQCGETGYPIVDAGMRELAETGFMHNRVRMITANFLCKLLLVNWQWGEAWFAEKLTDFELSSNNGNWQWSAGCGCDAAPYFRIFNPQLQAQKFDPDGEYVARWIPDYAPDRYVEPVVDYRMARQRALDIYKEALAAA